MLVTLLGIVMLVNPVQPEKASEPMLVTLSGIVMLVNPVQLLKAESLMLVPLVMTISSIALLLHCFTTAETASEGPVIFVKMQP